MQKEYELLTEDGNIKRYLNSDKIDEFKVNQIAYIGYPNGYGHGKRTSDNAFTLTANRGSAEQLYKQENLKIRRLTEKECVRLMGFADEDYYKMKQVCNDNQIVKQCGNSIVVDVLCAIFKEML